MKPNFMKSGLLLVAMAFFLVTSCSKEDNTDPVVDDTGVELTAEDSKQAAQAEETSDRVFDIVESAYVEIEEETRSNSFFPDCVTITISTENGVTFVTLDFGLGCELNNGNIVSGKIHITYGPPQNGTVTITYTLENFVFNNKEVAGGATVFRQRENPAGNPESIVNKDLLITFPAGLIVSVDAVKSFEWIEGVGSGTWMDNVYLVTGNRTIETNSGFSHYGLIVEPLRREATCPWFVSGTIEITRNGHMGVLDFGDGTCDNLATLLVNGEEIIIEL